MKWLSFRGHPMTHQSNRPGGLVLGGRPVAWTELDSPDEPPLGNLASCNLERGGEVEVGALELWVSFGEQTTIRSGPTPHVE